jgi:peptidase E
MEPDNPLLDDFVLSLARRQPAHICFVPTASADSATYIAKFYRTFTRRAVCTDLTLFDSLPRNPSRTADLRSFLLEQDVIYVGGGSTANLLAIWRAHGVDAIMLEAWANGAVLSGISAGMICWFESGLTDSYGPLEPLTDGLGLLEGSACPHYDGELERRSMYQKAIANGLAGGYAADDGVALHFRGAEFVEAVSSRAEARAYRVELVGGEVVERALDTRYLLG